MTEGPINPDREQQSADNLASRVQSHVGPLPEELEKQLENVKAKRREKREAEERQERQERQERDTDGNGEGETEPEGSEGRATESGEG